MKKRPQTFWESFNERDEQDVYTWWRWWMGPFLFVVGVLLIGAYQ